MIRVHTMHRHFDYPDATTFDFDAQHGTLRVLIGTPGTNRRGREVATFASTAWSCAQLIRPGYVMARDGGIAVHTSHGPIAYPGATGYHTDEHGRLTVTADNVTVGIHARHEWTCGEHVPPTATGEPSATPPPPATATAVDK